MWARAGHRWMGIEQGKPGGSQRMVCSPVKVGKAEIEITERAADSNHTKIVRLSAKTTNMAFNFRQRGTDFLQLSIGSTLPLLFRWTRAEFITRQQSGIDQTIA